MIETIAQHSGEIKTATPKITPREVAAFEIAVRICRGVFKHPDAFSYGLPGERGGDFDPFEAAVFHRLSQLGFSSHEIKRAYHAAYDLVDEEHEQIGFIITNPTWGHA
jgi:hypothetical protein